MFLLVGPSGVGKTETALALSDLLYGGERNMITINMSEFQEAHTVSTLKGSPPGYVGYGEGGVLTEAVRRRPYSVVLLDEVEKAHPDVLELFFQVFDKGKMEDGEGREIDFKNTIIILTSNAGTDTLMKLTADPETMPSAEGLVKALKPELDKIFKPAFLGRMVIIPYFPIRDEALKKIIKLKLGKIQRRLLETHKIALDLRRRAGRRSGAALHGSGKRRAQRGQHPDQYAAAGNLAADTRPHGGAAEAGGDPRRRRRGRLVHLQLRDAPRALNGGLYGSSIIYGQQPAHSTHDATGPNTLLAANLRGREAVSELFRFQIDTLTQATDPIEFESILGQTVTVAIEGKRRDPVHQRHGDRVHPGRSRRGVYALSAGGRAQSVDPDAQSQELYFQQQTVTDILKTVFTGLDRGLQWVTGTYPSREYCVQYRETDFNFASRLMEEEGIFYFFEHTSSGHTLMLGDNPQAFAAIGFQPDVTYETARGGGYNEDRILAWEKAQDLRSGETRLWDFKFQMPDKNCETTQQVLPTVQAGTVTHKFSVNDTSWELYDYPGGYAKRFDGVDKSGNAQASELHNIFTDNTRTMNIRMQAETAGAMTIYGKACMPASPPATSSI